MEEDKPVDMRILYLEGGDRMPVEPTDANSRYIGDGVYATQGRWKGELILWTDRDIRHHMSIEPRALQALIYYAREQGWEIK